MPPREVFPYPSVKQVIFQIRYPNLFIIENKIGDIQSRIMGEFPESALLLRRQIMLADVGNKGLEVIPQSEEISKKIWNFKSPKGYELNISSDSLDVTSEYHKTYDLFREIIDNVLVNFFDVIKIPVVNRVGLRYIDECPVFNKDNANFSMYYNTKLPIDTFHINEAENMEFWATVTRNNCYLRYGELFKKIGDNYKLILDFDSYTFNVRNRDCLTKSDDLHNIISDEYYNTIREPFKEYMRTGANQS